MIDALHPYPVEWIDRWQLSNGKAVTVRPVLPQDQPMEHEFVAQGLTSQSRYQRFQSACANYRLRWRAISPTSTTRTISR